MSDTNTPTDTDTPSDRPMPSQTTHTTEPEPEPEPETDTTTDTGTTTDTDTEPIQAAEAADATERVAMGNLAPDRLTETQAELIRLLAEYPAKQAKFYRERLDVSSAYLPTLLERYPEVLENEVPDSGGSPVYRLTPEAWEVYAAAGIVPEDTLTNVEAADVEVPSERHERGNVVFEGPPLDATMQYFHERPAAENESDSDAEPEAEADPDASAEAVAEDSAGAGGAGGASLTTRVGVELAHGDVLAVLTAADVDDPVKERLYRQAVGLAGVASSDG